MQTVEVSSVTKEKIAYLDALILEGGKLKLLPAEFYHQLPKDHLRGWCMLHGRYGVPTVELVAWVKDRIGTRTALEIGAGCGDLGRHVGIPMTDSYQQVTDILTALYILSLGQAVTKPSPDVSHEDAETAVRCRRPQVVVGSWITERFLGDVAKGGNIHGPLEENILDNCETYILIGNERVHGQKRILNRPHHVYQFPWLVSRAAFPKENLIYVWDNK